jgi:hypothetical protein|tara:strand:- start:1037 stop:1255 length:219 start_codon:yes stop_codon:yes gene_type:complete
MSGMPDFEAGQLVSAVKQLNKDVESLTRTMTKLNDRLAAQEIQLAKGKGMAAGVIVLAAILGGLSSYIMNKI